MYQQQYANAAYVPGDDCRALFAVTKMLFVRDEAKKASSRYFYIINTHEPCKFQTPDNNLKPIIFI